MTSFSVPPSAQTCDKCLANDRDVSQCPLPAIGRAEEYLAAHSHELSKNELAVMKELLILAREFHNVGKCAAPQERIAAKVGVTQQGVSKILFRLMEYYWIDRKVKGHAGKRISSKFHILPQVTSWNSDGGQAVRKDLPAPRPTRALPPSQRGPVAPPVVRGSIPPPPHRGNTSSDVPLDCGSSNNWDAQLDESTKLSEDPLTTGSIDSHNAQLSHDHLTTELSDPLTTEKAGTLSPPEPFRSTCHHGISCVIGTDETVADRTSHEWRGLVYRKDCWGDPWA